MSEDCTELVADGKLVRQMTGDDLRAEVKRLRGVLSAATERNGNLNVQLAAMTQERDALRQQVANLEYSNNAHREMAESWRAAAVERDALRREVEQLRREVRELARMASIECYLDECCPKQKALRPSNPNVCVDCIIEDARESIQAAQAGKACSQCGRLVEKERECYAVPTCHVCLPPPEPLPVRKAAKAGKEGAE